MRGLLLLKKKNILPDYLCFTANTAGSTVKLSKSGTPTSVTLETSTNGTTRTTYTIGDTITLANIGDKVYFRNTSETDTGFSTSYNSAYYRFLSEDGTLACSGDVTYLLNKNGTTTVPNYCFAKLFYALDITSAPELPATTLGNYCYYEMFYQTNIVTPPELPATTMTTHCYEEMFALCTSLTTAPELPATTLAINCYANMFQGCSNLNKLSSLPATTLKNYCYTGMFKGCSLIKLSTTQTGEYQTEYRIPTTGTGTSGTNSFAGMFQNTGGTFASTPAINTTYYTSNDVV